MGADEEAMHKTLRAYRDIIDGLIAQHEGRRRTVLKGIPSFQ